MARPLRIDAPDITYHVTSRGNERRPIFYSDEDRTVFLRCLAETVRRFGWSVSAWVLMTNHFHLVVETPHANLSRGMHWLLTKYASWFNRRHERSGHLFQGRFKSVIVDSETYFARVLRYVVLNPVRARMVTRPDQYRWSSYRASAGLDEAPEWLDLSSALTPFGGASELGHAAYRAFVLNGVGDDIWNELQHGMFLGSERWAHKMAGLVNARPRSTDHPADQRSIGRPPMHRVIESLARAAGIGADEIRSRRGHPLRAVAAWLGWNQGFHTLRSIAAALRLRSEGHISTLIRRCEQTLAGNAEVLGLLDVTTMQLQH